VAKSGEGTQGGQAPGDQGDGGWAGPSADGAAPKETVDHVLQREQVVVPAKSGRSSIPKTGGIVRGQGKAPTVPPRPAPVTKPAPKSK